jgi:dimethylhistidine N-methyltransferase
VKVVDLGGVELFDYEPADTLRAEVLAGLLAEPKHLPCKFFYDERGAELFEAICALDEYYPTRTELAIMERHGAEMARRMGARCRVVEYGSGSGRKTRILLDLLAEPAAYVPIDIARKQLLATARELDREYPDLLVQPVCADYALDLRLPPCPGRVERTVVYFPGSTIGNFAPPDAVAFLERVARIVGRRGGLLIGVDLPKDRALLEPAYDDALGVTAAFNLNLLARINRELGADFDLAGFKHIAFWDADESRIVMQLESLAAQRVSLGGRRFALRAGERITTEYSYKYGLAPFAAIAAQAGFEVEQVWRDERGWFSVQLLTLA